MGKETAPVEAVNKITVNFVAITENKGDGKYSLMAQWSANRAAPAQDNLWMWVSCEDGTNEKNTVSFYDNAGEMDFTVKAGKEHYFSVSDKESGPVAAICTPVKLLLCSYSGVKGRYENDMLRLTWDKPNKDIYFGESLLIPDGEEREYPKINEAIPRFVCQTALPLHRYDYGAAAVVKAVLYPYYSTLSCGLTAESGPVYLENPTIKTVDVQDVATLIISYTSPYKDDARAMVQPVLLHDGREVCKGDAQAMQGTGETKQLAWDLSKTSWCKDWPCCTLALYHCTATVCTAGCTEANTVALFRPVFAQPTAEKQGIRLRWEYPGAGERFTVEDKDKKTKTTYERQITVDCVALSNLDMQYTVRTERGPRSTPACAFVPGYYPFERGMRFYAKSYGETALSVSLGSGFFSSAPSAELKKGTLSVDADGVFHIDKSGTLTKAELAEWFSLLEENKITPSGYYRMRQLLARLAFSGNDDVLRAYCGMESGLRSAELFPGALLGIQSSAYQFQTGSNDDENAGMTAQSTDWYTLSLCELADGQVLCMDSFINRVQPGWTPFIGETGKTCYWGGELDFFLKTVRKPYMRVCYPQYFMLSAQPPTPYKSDNVVILASSSLSELDTAAKILMDTPTADLGQPHIICRSRAAVSLRHTVYLNGTAVQVPVGATLSEVVQPYSACHGDLAFAGVSLWRKALGEWTPVQLQLFEDNVIGSLPLLDGDRIEVK